jgi:hypothetical protein
MKFTLRPESRAEDDLFDPLRELRSPISMETIKSVVFNRAPAKFSLWNQLWSHVAEFLALGIVTAVAVNFSVFQGSGTNLRLIPSAKHFADGTNADFFADPASKTEPRSNSAHPLTIHTIDTIAAPSIIRPPETMTSIFLITGFRNEDATPIIPKGMVGNSILQPSLSSLSSTPGITWFSTLSSGAVFSHLRILGEEAEIGMDNGWESFGLAFTNASGNRDKHEILAYHSNESSVLFSESDQTLALFFGANYSIGPVAFKGELGPAYIISSSKFYDPITEVLGSNNVNDRMGMAAEISAFYHVSDFFQAGVTSISSYRTGQFTSGILVSVNLRP